MLTEQQATKIRGYATCVVETALAKLRAQSKAPNALEWKVLVNAHRKSTLRLYLYLESLTEKGAVPCQINLAMQRRDPVYQNTGGWWFADETWTHEDGPHATEAAARAALKVYADEFLGTATKGK